MSFKIPSIIKATIISAGVCAWGVALGQEASPPAATDTNSLSDIVVTARRKSERLMDVPITVTVQTGDDLTKAGVTDMQGLGKVVPGLTIAGEGPFFIPSLRGVGTSINQPGASNPIAVYVDGIFQPSLAGDFFELPDVSSIEVLKGPQGTLFGRNASAGAISIYTQDPSFTPTGSVSISDGVYFGGTARTSNDIATKFNVSGPLIDNILAGSITGYYQDVPGYLTDDVSGRRTGNIESYVYRGKLLFTPTEDLKFVLTAFHSTEFNDQIASGQAINGNSIAKYYPDHVIPTQTYHVASELRDGNNPVTTQQSGVSLRAEWAIPNAGTLTSLTGYTHVFTFYLADVDGAYSPTCVAAFVCLDPYLVDYGPISTFQQEFTFSSRRMGPVQFVAGLFFYHSSDDYASAVNPPLDGNGNLVPGAAAPYSSTGNVTTTAYAAFGEANTDITDSLHLTTGLRYSWERRTGRGNILNGPEFDVGGRPHWDSVTPRVSLRYDLSSSANIYATYSEGFKSGVLDIISLGQDVAQPEKLKSYEIGSKFGSQDLNFNTSFFYYDYRNLQVQFFNSNATTVIGNAQKATLYGLDFDGTARLGGGFQVHAGGSWLPHAVYNTLKDAVDFSEPMTPNGFQTAVLDASGQRILRSPRFSGNVSVDYVRESNIGKFDVNGIVYTSSKYSYDYLNNVESRFFFTLGGSVGFSPTGSRFHYSLWGRNLTNREHISGSNASSESFNAVYSPPREVGVKLDYAF